VFEAVGGDGALCVPRDRHPGAEATGVGGGGSGHMHWGVFIHSFIRFISSVNSGCILGNIKIIKQRDITSVVTERG